MAVSNSVSVCYMYVFFGLTIIHVFVAPVSSGSGGGAVTTTDLPLCKETTTAFSDPCSSSPCYHGTCIASSPTQFICECSVGWRGDLCDTGFLCGDGDNTCLPFSVICNNVNECPNAFDESRCCGDFHSDFMCGSQADCRSWMSVCDGTDNCPSTPYDETIFCNNSCSLAAATTTTASPVAKKACRTTTMTLTSTTLTSLSSSTSTSIVVTTVGVVSVESTETTPTAVTTTTTNISTPISNQNEKEFFDDPANIALLSIFGGMVVVGGVALAGYYTAKKCQQMET